MRNRKFGRKSPRRGSNQDAGRLTMMRWSFRRENDFRLKKVREVLLPLKDWYEEVLALSGTSAVELKDLVAKVNRGTVKYGFPLYLAHGALALALASIVPAKRNLSRSEVASAVQQQISFSLFIAEANKGEVKLMNQLIEDSPGSRWLRKRFSGAAAVAALMREFSRYEDFKVFVPGIVIDKYGTDLLIKIQKPRSWKGVWLAVQVKSAAEDRLDFGASENSVKQLRTARTLHRGLRPETQGHQRGSLNGGYCPVTVHLAASRDDSQRVMRPDDAARRTVAGILSRIATEEPMNLNETA